jgi:hypothetical protein
MTSLTRTGMSDPLMRFASSYSRKGHSVPDGLCVPIRPHALLTTVPLHCQSFDHSAYAQAGGVALAELNKLEVMCTVRLPVYCLVE